MFGLALTIIVLSGTVDGQLPECNGTALNVCNNNLDTVVYNQNLEADWCRAVGEFRACVKGLPGCGGDNTVTTTFQTLINVIGIDFTDRCSDQFTTQGPQETTTSTAVLTTTQEPVQTTTTPAVETTTEEAVQECDSPSLNECRNSLDDVVYNRSREAEWCGAVSTFRTCVDGLAGCGGETTVTSTLDQIRRATEVNLKQRCEGGVEVTTRQSGTRAPSGNAGNNNNRNNNKNNADTTKGLPLLLIVAVLSALFSV